jgi:hypothetical protein
MKIKIIVAALLCACLFNACDKATKDSAILSNRAGEKPVTEQATKEGTGYFTDSTGQTTPGEPEQKKQPRSSGTIPDPDWDKKIIRTASLNFEVKDYNSFSSAYREKIKSLGGYIAQEEQTQSDYKIENSITIKVPVDQFDNAVAQLSSNAGKINERKISSQDVTGEYVDTRSRIEARKQVRQRYMDLLKQAKNMEEILSVQAEINGIQEEIESATGRIDYLGHSSAFSTINLTYYQVLNSSAKTDSKPSLGTKITEAFKTGAGWIGDLLVGLISIWPLFLLVFILLILFRKFKPVKTKQA